jgi:hypothetical protein
MKTPPSPPEPPPSDAAQDGRRQSEYWLAVVPETVAFVIRAATARRQTTSAPEFA